MEAPDFFVEDLLDLSNGGDEMMTDASFFDTSATTTAGNSTDSSTVVTPVDSCNSSHSPHFPDAHFSGDLCVPYDDLAELEWLSNFVEDSFSSDDLQKLHQLMPVHPSPNPARPAGNPASSSVPGKARSKRSRVAPCDWSTRLLMVAPPSSSNNSGNGGGSHSLSSTSPATSSTSQAQKKAAKKREALAVGPDPGAGGEARRCLHCAAEKTPQWRTGPMGPKTLCNACGVRYKSGRLVPEYRPAASPTFVSAKHSNSHRKVMELRRQKDMQRQHHQQHFLSHQMMVASNGGDDPSNYLIHHHLGPDYRQLI